MQNEELICLAGKHLQNFSAIFPQFVKEHFEENAVAVQNPVSQFRKDRKNIFKISLPQSSLYIPA